MSDSKKLYALSCMAGERTISDILYRTALRGNLRDVPADELCTLYMNMSSDVRSEDDMLYLLEMGAYIYSNSHMTDEALERYEELKDFSKRKKTCAGPGN